MTDLTALDIASTVRAVRARALGPTELVRAFLARVESQDPGLGAFLRVDAEGALATARALESRDDLDALPLAGVVLAVKDCLCTRGLRTTCGSRMLERWVPPYDAHVVARLRASGAIVLGKTNMDEFAMGSSTENSAFFPTRNPRDPSRVPGGSSGGSAVAVAARMAQGALGTDTGGSVRQPAALTGVVGFKPTYGRVSRYGLVAFASSLDVVSPFGGSVGDVAAVYEAIAGHDPRDGTSASLPVEPVLLPEGPEVLRGLRVGVPREYFSEGLDDVVRARVESALDALQRAGAVLVPLSMPHTRYAVAAYYVLATAEASANLARYDGVRYGLRVEGRHLKDLYGATRDRGFGPEVKRRILLGTFALSAGYQQAFYGRAQRARAHLREDFRQTFAQVDVVATPTSPTVAFPLGQRVDDPVAMYQADVCTLPASLAGVPALSLPVGESPSGLPVGLQLLAPHFAEARLLRVARGVEALGLR
ncbi:MAG: Asp-tRNA(Asn)/Glu-tRNA(Gln) amidotransferase subunit GatA [Deltaproteobacteria bacterium]|nr:Asp-tRNA(Asn)/Glu-tRNA(Gln) amidotransferase subunit GatA [Deltaproteobacteria bacterium]